MVNREDVNIIETTSQNEYFSNKEQVYPFENKKFMLGVGISAISTPGSCSHQSTKFTLHQNLKVVNEENITENSDEQITPIEWNETHFPSLYNYQSTISNESIYWFPYDSVLSGTVTSQRYDSLAILIRFESDSSWEMTFEEYIQEVSAIQVFVFFNNEILDPHNFDDPVQQIYNDKYLMLIDPKDVTFINFYARK